MKISKIDQEEGCLTKYYMLSHLKSIVIPNMTDINTDFYQWSADFFIRRLGTVLNLQEQESRRI